MGPWQHGENKLRQEKMGKMVYSKCCGNGWMLNYIHSKRLTYLKNIIAIMTITMNNVIIAFRGFVENAKDGNKGKIIIMMGMFSINRELAILTSK